MIGGFATAGSAPPGAPTILFVDDEELILQALVRQLRSVPYRVLATRSPREALRLVLAERVDVLVSDLDMPEMNGLELTSQVRRSHPEVVRVVITGQATVGTVMQAINEGEVFRFLAKPWRAEELMEVLSAAVKRREEPSLTPPPGLLDARRAQQLAALERAQPGLTAVPRGVGVHVVDERRLQGLLARLGRPPWQAPDEPARRPTHKGIPIA